MKNKKQEDKLEKERQGKKLEKEREKHTHKLTFNIVLHMMEVLLHYKICWRVYLL